MTASSLLRGARDLSLVVIAGLGLGRMSVTLWGPRGATEASSEEQVSEQEEITTYRGVIRSAPVPPANSLLFLVSSGDVATCEDLGHQVRMFLQKQSTSEAKPRLYVWVPAGDDTVAVATFLRHERIPHAGLDAVSLTERIGGEILTPAMLVLGAAQEFVGAGYARGVKHVRSMSFVDVLVSGEGGESR